MDSNRATVGAALMTAIRPLRPQRLLIAAILPMTLGVVVIVAMSLGPVNIAFGKVLSVILDDLGVTERGDYTERERLVVEHVRVPRVLVGALVGATLGVSGVIMQGLFRNPLAEPGVIGVSSGAAVGAVIALIAGGSASSRWLLPISAFAGAAGSLGVISAIAAASTRRSFATLLLVGIAVNAFFGAVISLLIANAPNEPQLRSIVFWMQGGLEGRTSEHVRLTALPAAIAVVIGCTFARDLNLLLLGETHARSAGVNTTATRIILLVAASLGTATAVAVSGVIGFVGLVVPHALRLAIGPDHRILLPASAIGGAIFLVLSDLVARVLFMPVALPVGTITALAGAPIFLLLLVRGHKESVV
jgi:iron complex transport system permease protein